MWGAGGSEALKGTRMHSGRDPEGRAGPGPRVWPGRLPQVTPVSSARLRRLCERTRKVQRCLVGSQASGKGVTEDAGTTPFTHTPSATLHPSESEGADSPVIRGTPNLAERGRCRTCQSLYGGCLCDPGAHDVGGMEPSPSWSPHGAGHWHNSPAPKRWHCRRSTAEGFG